MPEYTETPEESLTLADTLIRSGILSETLAVTDTLLRNPVLEETITLEDSISRGKIFTESLTLTDGGIYGTEVLLTETLTLTDYLLRNPVLEETFAVGDTFSHVLVRVLTEVLTLDDGDYTGGSQRIISTNGAWGCCFSSNISLEVCIQNFINYLDKEQLPINMLQISCSAFNTGTDTEFQCSAVIKKH